MFSRKEIFFIVALVLLPVIPAAFISRGIEVKETNVKNDPFRKKISEISDDVIWIDARDQKKYDQKHIPGAVLIDAKYWEEGLAKLFEVFEPGKTIVVYCNAGCSSSSSVAERLRKELGQENIYYLHGGMDSWFSKEQ